MFTGLRTRITKCVGRQFVSCLCWFGLCLFIATTSSLQCTLICVIRYQNLMSKVTGVPKTGPTNTRSSQNFNTVKANFGYEILIIFTHMTDVGKTFKLDMRLVSVRVSTKAKEP